LRVQLQTTSHGTPRRTPAAQFLGNPNSLVIDLDPREVPFAQVVQVAGAVHKTLDKADVQSFCKTSGKQGLHVFVPLAAQYDYDEARRFAEIVAHVVQKQLPDMTSVVRMPAQRKNKIYLDFLQNARGQTLAAPYSLRPTAEATVSTPLKWQEVKRGLDPTKFTIRTLQRRLDRIGDVWKGVLGPGAELRHALAKLS
jgi:bifunctional non-homologous end joining protein LigD